MLFILILASIAVLPLLAFIVWRRRWGYPPRGVPAVLAYHKVAGFEFGGTWVSPGRFASQIDRLLESGYRFIGEKDFLAVVRGERGGLRRELLLTFDDGYRRLLDAALPLLDSRRVSALIFVVTSFVGRDNLWELGLPGGRIEHLRWDEILDLAGRGFSFGSHTATHRDLTRLAPAEVEHELAGSREVLERRLGGAVSCLSYPFGRTNEAVSVLAARTGYRAAFTLCPARTTRTLDPYEIRREGIYVIDTLATIRSRIDVGPLFWLEDLKGRAINGVAVLTPLLKGSRAAGSEELRSRS